jgi:stage IV sporulation protein FB
MLKFSLWGVPVAVDWWFWLATALLGGGATAQDAQDWTRVIVWMGVVFVSILVHELGHAALGRSFGASPFIRLHGFGGVTFLPGARFKRSQNLIVSAAGPLAGLLLGLLVLLVRHVELDRPPMAHLAVTYALYINFVWTAINLLPISPLDGGQMLAQLLGPRRAQATAWVGFTVASALCVWSLWRGLVFFAFMLAMLAYYNIRRQPVEGGVVTP